MHRFDTSISSVGEDMSKAGFKTGDQVSVVKTSEVLNLEKQVAELNQKIEDMVREKSTNDKLCSARIKELEQTLTVCQKELRPLDKASTAFVVKKQDGTYVRRGKNALYITYSRSMAKHRASAFVGSTVHEVKLVINPEHVASTCVTCGRVNHG